MRLGRQDVDRLWNWNDGAVVGPCPRCSVIDKDDARVVPFPSAELPRVRCGSLWIGARRTVVGVNYMSN